MTITVKNTMAEIVEAYNNLTDLKVKKFSTKEVGVKRLNKLLETSEPSSVLSQVLDPLEKSHALFPTKFSTLHLPDGSEIPDRQAVIDSSNNSYVSTVGKTYQLINNRECFTHFANVLSSSKLNTAGMKVKPYVTKTKCYVHFTFPEHRVEIRKNDFTELMITARNSYDGSSRFIIEIGGFRLTCSNGMGIGSYTNVYSNKHSSGYDEEKMGRYVETALEVFEQAGKEWQKMTKIAVTDNEAFEVIKLMVERKTEKAYKEVLEGKNTKLKEGLQEWERYKNEMGSNKFSLYNTITHLSSHATTEKGNIVGLKVTKDKLRDKTLSSKKFFSLRLAVNQ